MITEQMCLDVIRALHGRTATLTQTLNPDDQSKHESSSKVEHGMAPARLVRLLLPNYSLSDIETTLRWLEYGEYVGYTGFGFAPKMVIHLNPKGVEFAERGQLVDAERRFVYQVDPYACFVARQFRSEDDDLFVYFRDTVLKPLGITALDGKAEGLESFRGDIIQKIKRARFFVCLLTHRSALATGSFASSVWLYQETGAAVALGKKPLVLVETGMDDHYSGELQKTYEYIPFDRANFRLGLDEAGRRLRADLEANHIAVPPAAT